MKKLHFLVFSALFLILLAATIINSLAPKCEWIITNCCPENAGARWECVNVKTYEQKLNCSEVQVICPQILSPKPKLRCVLEENRCVAR